MATLGNYVGALGGMAKDATVGAGKAFVGGLKGAFLRETPGLTAGYAFGKELSKRANAPKMQPGDTPPPVNQQTSTSPVMGGLAASVSLIAGQNKSNVINLEQVRQLKQLNDSVIVQSKLISFQISDQKRKDQFAEENANEQAIRDDALLQAIKQIGSRDSSGKKSSDDGRGGSSSFLGKIGDLISDNLGTLASLYLGGKGLGAAGRVLGGVGRGAAGQAAGSIAGRAVPQIAGRAAGAVIDVEAKVISSTVARGALAEGVATIVPMVLRFLTGPIGMGIMAAAGIGAYLYSKRDPEKAASAAANSAVKKLDTAPPASSGAHSKAKITQDEAKALMEDRAIKEEVAVKAEAEAKRISESPSATKQQIETAKKFAEGRRKAVDYDINAMGGLNRVQTIAEGKKDPGAPVTMDKYLQNLARTESANKANPNGDPNATSKTSTAAGLYQFLGDYKDKNGDTVQGTWKTQVNSMVKAGVLTKEDAEANYMDDKFRFDPAKATKVAAFFTEKNRVGLKSALGRDPTETDLYMAHFMGLGDNKSGAINYLKMMDQNPNALGVDVAGKGPAAANAPIFYEGGDITKPRTISQIYAMMGQRLTGNKSGIPAQTVEAPTGKEKTITKQKQKDDLPPDVEIDNTVAKFHDKLGQAAGGGPGSTSNVGIVPSVLGGGGGGPGSTSNVGIVPSVLGGGGGGGDDNNPYSLSGAGDRSRGMGGGTGLKFKKEAILVEDPTVKKAIDNVAKGLGVDPKRGTQLPTKETSAGTALQTKAFKPLFKNNSDIIAETNKTFLQQFRQTATSAFQQAITKGLFPKGFGVDAATAGRDDNYRGQQLQKIFGTDKVISDATTKLLGKQYGPMFAPLFNNLAQGYLEVGSRVAGKAIFQGIGGLGAQETQTITGQVLGNLASGNKKLAFEQLLYGASGGKNGGIALGPETLLAKYGFNNPAEGIQYFASALGERATQPFAKMMGADDRNKSVIFDPRTKQYVYADTGAPASQADIQASGNYGAPVSQATVFSPGMNNYGMPGNPYGTTAGVNGTYRYNNTGAQYQQILNAKEGTGPSRAQFFGLTDQQQAAGGAKLIAEQNTLLRAQGEVQNKQLEQQAKLAEEAAKREFEIASKKASSDAEQAQAQAAYDKALNEAKTSTDKVDTDRVIAKLDQVGGRGSGSGTQILDKDGNPVVRQSGQLFGQSIGPDGKVISDPMKEIGNFAFDMGKNMLGQQLTKGIKNPYMQMVANFAIQKGLNYGVDALFGKGGLDLGKMFEGAGSSIMDFFGFGGGSTASTILDSSVSTDLLPEVFSLFAADGGLITGPGTGRSDSVPAMLSNGEFVVNAGATKKYRPLLDALNITKYADGTSSTPGSVKALSTALGTDKQLNALGDQTDLLTSIDNSLLKISGGGGGSGTSVSSYGGASWDIGLGPAGGGSVSSGGGGATVRQGVSRSNATRQSPSTMDYVTAIGGSVLKSMAISQGIGMASTALFGATPMALAGNFISGAQMGMAGLSPATFVGPLQPGVATGMELFGGGSAAGSTAPVLAEGGTALAEGGTVLAETTALGGLEAGLAAIPGWGWAALGVIAAVSIFGGGYGGGGGGGSRPPPKEPKYHAAIYVLGNNNINAIATIYETQDYHAVPDTYKTVAYGLLRVAFNATKVSEQSTKMPAPYDWLYIKVQFDKVALLWGKGAPSPESLISDTATEVKTWDALTPDTNLSAYAQDIINLIRDEFKKTAVTDNLAKLDKAAADISGYSLNTLSKDLIPDLKSAGVYKLDSSIQKGIYADNVDESNRIGELVNAAAKHGAYMSTAMAAEYDEEGNITKAATAGGVPMVWSVKDGAFVENKYPGALILDGAGRPVYDIEGTSAGLTKSDFGGTDIVGINRPANVLLPPPPVTTAGGTGTNNTVVEGAKIDNSSVTNFYNSLGTVTDYIRSTTNQVGVIG